MKKLLSYEMMLEMKNPEVENVLRPGALIAIFSLAQGDDVIQDEIPEKRILKAIWLVAICFPKCCVTIKDLAAAIFVEPLRVRDVIDREFLESNSKLVAETKIEIEKYLNEASIIIRKIERRGFLHLDQVGEIRTTFLDVLNPDEWISLEWPLVIREEAIEP